MTSYYALNISRRAPFRFRPILDGLPYNCVVTWGLQPQRPVLNIFNGANALLLSIPAVGTPDALPVNFATYDDLADVAVLELFNPHPYEVGTLVTINAFGFTPDGYNGVFKMLAATATSLQFASTYLDDASTQGFVSQDLNLIEGYFSTSRMIYRASTGQFEVTP